MTLLQSPLGDHLPGWILVGLVASAFLLLRRLSGPQAQISHFPLLGKEYGSRRKRVEAFLDRPVEVYAEGYRRFKDQIYRLTVPDGEWENKHDLGIPAVFDHTVRMHLTKASSAEPTQATT